MLGVGFSLTQVAGHRTGGATAPPPAAINAIVIEGDSITSTMPSTPNSMYSYQYGSHRSDKTVVVRAQGSRTVGPIAQLNDNGNTLVGNLAEDLAYRPDLITAMLGANDLGFATAASYRTNLTNYYAALKAAAPAVKFAWSPPTAYNPTGTPHPNYAQYMADRASILATCRDPAVWGQWTDYYLPVGEHPDLNDPTLAAALFSDAVHPSESGDDLLYAIYRAAMDSILDATRVHATVPYEAVWPTDQPGLEASTPTTVRFIVAGVAHTGLASGIAAMGGGALVRVNGNAWSTSIGRIYNGDVVDVRMTSGATPGDTVTTALRIGSETRMLTFATAADVPQVTIADQGGQVFVYAGANSHSFAIDLTQEGALVVWTRGKYDDQPPVAISVGGAAMTKRGNNFGGVTQWTVEVTAAGGGGTVATGSNRTVFVDCANGVGQLCPITWCVAVGADAAPVAVQVGNRGGTANPQLSDTLTVPSKGVALGVFAVEATASGYSDTTANAPCEFVARAKGAAAGSVADMMLAKRTSSGRLSWENAAGGSVEPINALVLKARTS